MKQLLTTLLLLAAIAGKAQRVGPWIAAPVKYAIEYNWFPDNNEIVQSFYKTGFPCRIRDWKIIPSNYSFFSGDHPSIWCDIKIINIADPHDKKKNDYLPYYNYHFSVSSIDGEIDFHITRDSSEVKRIDSIIKKQFFDGK